MALAEAWLFELSQFLISESELLIVKSDEHSFYARSSEVSIISDEERCEITFPFEKGEERWAVADVFLTDRECVIEVFHETDGSIELVRLVPRTAMVELGAGVEEMRLRRANAIAAGCTAIFGRAKAVKVELSHDNARFADIVLELPSGRRIAAIADVSESLTPEFLLSAAVVLLAKLRKRKRKPIRRVAVIASRVAAVGVQKLRALLKPEWQSAIEVLAFEDDGFGSDGQPVVTELASVVIDSLWHGRRREVEPVAPYSASALAESLLMTAPEAVDVVRTRNGETVRYNGLPFARIRNIGGRTRVWAGVTAKQVIDEGDFGVLHSFVGEIADRRRHDAQQKRHEYFRLGPEAWLESMLRRNIRLLDPNLVLSPVYHQFRAERDKIDLLALRSDGRLVIIEVKVSSDREMIYQAADYWRKIEAERRCGNLEALKLFGDLEIADRPAVVYLVAPTLSYHPDFDLLVSTLDSDVPVCRFDLNENWRKEVKVFRRTELGGDRIAEFGFQIADFD